MKTTDRQFLSIYQPKGEQRNQPINCRSSLTYVDDTIETFEAIEDATNSTKDIVIDPIRKRRDVVIENVAYPVNRTFYLNCTNPDVICSKIICAAGPFVTLGQDDVNMILQMEFNSSKIYGMSVSN